MRTYVVTGGASGIGAATSARLRAHVAGQVLFVDGGADAVLRGDTTW